MRELNKHDNMQFDQYIVRKLRAWYTKFPPSGGDGQRDSDESNEAIALSGEE